MLTAELAGCTHPTAPKVLVGDACAVLAILAASCHAYSLQQGNFDLTCIRVSKREHQGCSWGHFEVE